MSLPETHAEALSAVPLSAPSVAQSLAALSGAVEGHGAALPSVVGRVLLEVVLHVAPTTRRFTKTPTGDA